MTERLEGHDVCCLIHTALRKCADSPITTAAYNLIHVIHVKSERFDPWLMFGTMVAERLQDMTPQEAFAHALEGFDDRFFSLADHSSDYPDGCRHLAWALEGVLRCFSKADIAAAAAYLEDD